MRDPGLSPSELAETFSMPADGGTGRREKPGLKKRDRLAYNKEAYCYIDPDYLSMQQKPPVGLQKQLEEVFGQWRADPDGTERLKLRMHPHMKRWAMWERAFIPKLGKNLWKCIWICQEQPVQGVLPSDYEGDILKAHFAGQAGEYRLPTRQDFLEIEQYNKAKYGVTAVTDQAGKWQAVEEAALEAKADEQIAAFLDENWFLAWDEANQAAGSGQYMRDTHCRNWTYKGNIERYRRIQKNGYVLIEKKSKEDFQRDIARETVKLLRKEDKLIVEELLRERLASMSDAETDADVQPLTAEQGSKLAALARENRDRVLQSLRLAKRVKTL